MEGKKFVEIECSYVVGCGTLRCECGSYSSPCGCKGASASFKFL